MAEQPRTKEFNGKQFEIVSLDVLEGSDIGHDDRAFIYTETGNRYMLRRSKSQQSLTVSNEREDKFQSHFPVLARPNKPIARVGQSYNYFKITDVAKNLGVEGNSSTVVKIEIIKGIDRAIKEYVKDQDGRTSFGQIAAMLIDSATPRLE